MSNAHAYMHADDQVVSPLGRSLKEAVVSLRISADDLAHSVATGFSHRLAMDDMSRMSDHRLRDMGFERDWDGSILPILRGQKHPR